jgi:hypothetical protein
LICDNICCKKSELPTRLFQSYPSLTVTSFIVSGFGSPPPSNFLILSRIPPYSLLIIPPSLCLRFFLPFLPLGLLLGLEAPLGAAPEPVLPVEPVGAAAALELLGAVPPDGAGCGVG